jgi:hypothetical protein
MAKRKKSGPPEPIVVPLKGPRITTIRDEAREPRELLVSSDAPAKVVGFGHRLFSPSETIGPVPRGAPRLSLQKVIQALHDSEINAGLRLQTFYDCGLQVWIGDELNGLEAKASMEADRDGTWPGDGAIALWLHTTALRLWPGSEYEKRYGGRRAAGLRIG